MSTEQVRADQIKAGDRVTAIGNVAGTNAFAPPAVIEEAYHPFHLPALVRLVIGQKVYQTHANAPVTRKTNQ